MHHFMSKVSIEKFQGDERARLSYQDALIDKTPIFYAFDISTTCQYFKVLLFIVDTIDIYTKTESAREREKKIKIFSSRKTILLISETSRAIKNNGSITFTSVETEAFINHKIAYKAGKRESTSRNEKTGKRTRLRVRAVMTPEYLMAFVVVDPLERQILNRCQLNSFRVTSGCSLAPQ